MNIIVHHPLQSNAPGIGAVFTNEAFIDVGPVTLRDIQTVLPFGNKVIMIETDGASILDGLEKAIDSDPVHFGKSYPMTAGFYFEADLQAPLGQRVKGAWLNNGRPIQPTYTYTVAISTFVYNGGDGVDSFTDDPIIQDTAMEDATAFYQYLTDFPTLQAGGPTVDTVTGNAIQPPSHNESIEDISIGVEVIEENHLPKQSAIDEISNSSNKTLTNTHAQKVEKTNALPQTGATIIELTLGVGSLLSGLGLTLKRKP